MEEEEAEDKQGQVNMMAVEMKNEEENELAKYQECYDLLLSGNVELLEQKLKSINKKVSQPYAQN